jgi:hypothetical protein
LLANPFLHYQRNNSVKDLTGYYCDVGGVGHCVKSTKIVVVLVVVRVVVVVMVMGVLVVVVVVVVLLLMFMISRNLNCHSEGTS